MNSLTGLHFLTTYSCNFQCDHCFLYCSPRARGTFTAEQVRRVLDQAERIGTINMVFFEGGEPFLFYPLVRESIAQARRRGFDCGIVTNGYWATSPEDAELWLRPLAELGLKSLGVSDDALHYGLAQGRRSHNVLAAAKKLGIDAKIMCTDRPIVTPAGGSGRPTLGGDVMFRGRAVERAEQMVADGEALPRRPWRELISCPHEKLDRPGRVHLDCFGHVHLCQGLSMGNFWRTPLSDLVRQYDPQAHPIVGPLLRGGPAELARTYGVPVEEGYFDECHLCFAVRRALLDRFPELLAPRQVYGLE